MGGERGAIRQGSRPTGSTADVDPDEPLGGVPGTEGAQVADGEAKHRVTPTEETAAGLVVHVRLALVKLQRVSDAAKKSG